MKIIFLLTGILFVSVPTFTQDARSVMEQLKAKNDKVKDYEAAAKMKTNVVFIKAPVADIRIYYKNPDQVKIKNVSGVSFIPKGSVNINMGNIFSIKNYTAIDAGREKINGTDTRVIKIIPEDENAEVVLATLYVDEKNLLVLRSRTTTKENGTYELDMTYKKYAGYGLPDQLTFSFNTKDFKLPKGVTFDYDNGSDKMEKKADNKKGTVEISFSSYSVNKGISEDVFK